MFTGNKYNVLVLLGIKHIYVSNTWLKTVFWHVLLSIFLPAALTAAGNIIHKGSQLLRSSNSVLSYKRAAIIVKWPPVQLSYLYWEQLRKMKPANQMPGKGSISIGIVLSQTGTCLMFPCWDGWSEDRDRETSSPGSPGKQGSSGGGDKEHQSAAATG